MTNLLILKHRHRRPFFVPWFIAPSLDVPKVNKRDSAGR